MSPLNNSRTQLQTQNSSRTKKIVVLSIAAGALLVGLIACSESKPSKPAAANVSTQPQALPAATASATPAPVAPPAIVKKKAKKRPANIVYDDAATGISFQYPRQYKLSVGEEQLKSVESEPLPMNFAQAGGATLALITVPKATFPGTDFDSAALYVNVNKELSEAQCGQFAFSSDSAEGPVSATKVKLGDREFAAVDDISASATKARDSRYYHLFENGACYEFAIGMQRSNADQEGLNSVDREKVFNKLEKVVSSVKVQSPASHEVANTTAASETQQTNR